MSGIAQHDQATCNADSAADQARRLLRLSRPKADPKVWSLSAVRCVRCQKGMCVLLNEQQPYGCRKIRFSEADRPDQSTVSRSLRCRSELAKLGSGARCQSRSEHGP